MEGDNPKFSKPLVVTALITVGILFLTGIYYYVIAVKELNKTQKELSEAEKKFAAAKADYENKIIDLEGELSLVQDQNTVLSGSLTDEQAKNNFLSQQVTGIQGTVSTLENLNKTDRELLKKYSKVYFLNENYKPTSLTDIDSQYVYDYKKDAPLKILTDVWPFLQKMLEAAKSESSPLEIISAYRSFGQQAILKTGYTMIYGAGTANQFSADQGYSEHQLGTTLDFTTPALGASFTKFESSTAYKWLNDNAYKYGFVISYPKQNTYYRFEPWHWRFVGIDLATKLHISNQYFYDLDQREIDLYLISLFSQTNQ